MLLLSCQSKEVHQDSVIGEVGVSVAREGSSMAVDIKPAATDLLGLWAYQTPNGVKIDYQFTDSSYFFLTWQVNGKIRTLPDTFFYGADPGIRPRFMEESKDYVLLRFSCSFPCWGGIILPLSTEQEPETFQYYYDVDLAHNLIAYIDTDQETNAAVIKVKNLKSGKIEEIEIAAPCMFVMPAYCLDSLSLSKRVLYYQWTTVSDEYKERKVSRTIKIKL